MTTATADALRKAARRTRVSVPIAASRIVVVGPPPKPNRKRFPFVGTIEFQGLKIDVENKRGSTRRGVDPDGRPWAVEMLHHYGEIRGTEGADGDKLDVYVGPSADSPLVVVVHQQDPASKEYDEDKVMLGFLTAKEALAAYRAQYNRRGFYQSHDSMPIGEFARWVADRSKRGEMVTLDDKLQKAFRPHKYIRRVLKFIGGKLRYVCTYDDPAGRRKGETTESTIDKRRRLVRRLFGDVMKDAAQLIERLERRRKAQSTVQKKEGEDGGAEQSTQPQQALELPASSQEDARRGGDVDPSRRRPRLTVAMLERRRRELLASLDWLEQHDKKNEVEWTKKQVELAELGERMAALDPSVLKQPWPWGKKRRPLRVDWSKSVPAPPKGRHNSAVLRELRRIEEEIRGEPEEHAYVVGADGRVVASADGDESHVRVSVSNGTRENIVLTHNHPGGGAFSVADIVAAIGMDVAEMRAVAPRGTWVLRRPAGGWPPKRSRELFLAILNADYKNTVRGRMKSEPKKKGESSDERWERINSEEIVGAVSETSASSGFDIKIEFDPSVAGSVERGGRAHRQGRVHPPGRGQGGAEEGDHGRGDAGSGSRQRLTPTRQHEEVGEHVWGSRADKARLRSASDLDQLTPAEAAKAVTKAKLVPKFNHEELRQQGFTPGGVLLRRAVAFETAQALRELAKGGASAAHTYTSREGPFPDGRGGMRYRYHYRDESSGRPRRGGSVPSLQGLFGGGATAAEANLRVARRHLGEERFSKAFAVSSIADRLRAAAGF